MNNEVHLVSSRWERMELSPESTRYLQGTHAAWSCICDGEHIMTVLPVGQTPGAGDGGYYSLDSALKAKGMM